MAKSAKLALDYLDASQAQKHVTVNKAIKAYDALVQLSALDVGRVVPPNGPAAGDVYTVGSGATGVWAGQDDNVAYYDGTAWVFYTPLAGWLVYAQDEDLFYRYNGGWDVAPVENTFDQLGVGGATPDGTNKFAFYGTNMLFNSGGSIDATFNKNGAANDASFSFKQGFAAKAIMGLLGNNDFTLKVGAGFNTALVADEATGRVSFPNGGGAPNICQLRNNDTTTDINTASYTDVPLNGVEDVRDVAWFTRSGNGVQCNKAGRVRVTASVRGTSTIQRGAFALAVAVNGTALPGAGQSSYMRGSGTFDGTSYITRWVDVAASDVITIQSIQAGVAGVITMLDGDGILIVEQW